MPDVLGFVVAGSLVNLRDGGAMNSAMQHSDMHRGFYFIFLQADEHHVRFFDGGYGQMQFMMTTTCC